MKETKVKVLIQAIKDTRPDPRGGMVAIGTAFTVIYKLPESMQDNGFGITEKALDRAKVDFPETVAKLRGFKSVEYSVQAVEVLE